MAGSEAALHREQHGGLPGGSSGRTGLRLAAGASRAGLIGAWITAAAPIGAGWWTQRAALPGARPAGNLRSRGACSGRVLSASFPPTSGAVAGVNNFFRTRHLFLSGLLPSTVVHLQ